MASLDLLTVATAAAGIAGTFFGSFLRGLRERRQAARISQLPGSPTPLPPPVPEDHSRPRVLVIDDEPSFARVVQRALSKLGLQVDTAGSAAEARALVARHGYALIVCDQMLPNNERGDRLLAELRIRTILQSGHYTDEDADRVKLETGVDCVMPKPATLEELERTVRALLEGRKLS